MSVLNPHPALRATSSHFAEEWPEKPLSREAHKVGEGAASISYCEESARSRCDICNAKKCGKRTRNGWSIESPSKNDLVASRLPQQIMGAA